jgi:hypothetical protein
MLVRRNKCPEIRLGFSSALRHLAGFQGNRGAIAVAVWGIDRLYEAVTSYLILVAVTLPLWVAFYLTLSRFLFVDRKKKWERMEDMMNEGAQTTLLSLLSGVLAIAAGLTVSCLVGWI